MKSAFGSSVVWFLKISNASPPYKVLGLVIEPKQTSRRTRKRRGGGEQEEEAEEEEEKDEEEEEEEEEREENKKNKNNNSEHSNLCPHSAPRVQHPTTPGAQNRTAADGKAFSTSWRNGMGLSVCCCERVVDLKPEVVAAGSFEFRDDGQ